jgi:hypothetical protein
MKDNQKKYLDKVVSLLVRDTNIEYGSGEVYPPNSTRYPHSYYFTSHFSISRPSPPTPDLLLEYCKDNYGLVGVEIEYVWDQYRDIIIDMIEDKYYGR